MSLILATSVVRGSRQGDSHGGAYLIDLKERRARQVLDWNAPDIDWAGRGWDRGLRGIAFGDDRVFIAASDELFAFDKDFRRIAGWRHPALRHAHEIARGGDRVYVVSTGHDAILAFDLAAEAFTWGLRLEPAGGAVRATVFDPADPQAAPASNALHLNTVSVSESGDLFIAGLRTPGLLRWSAGRLSIVCSLPAGTHNARPYRDGVLFNDTQADMVRFVTPSRQRTFSVPAYAEAEMTHLDLDDTRIARPGFARGLCLIGDGMAAAGSSPSTIAVHDLDANRTRQIVTLSKDVRNAIHGLAPWPFG